MPRGLITLDSGLVVGTGWLREEADGRDIPYSGALYAADALPVSVDWRRWVPPPSNQEQTNACVGHATSKAVSSVAWTLAFPNGDTDETIAPDWSHYEASALECYFLAREIDGNTNQDQGTYPRSGMQAAASVGLCDLSLHPLNLSTSQRPSQDARAEGGYHRITRYESVPNNEQAVCSVLAQGYVIVWGWPVYEPDIRQVGADGLVPMPGRTSRQVGGHATLIVGYDRNRRLYWGPNSWGPTFGEHGYIYHHFDFVHRYGGDMWTPREGLVAPRGGWPQGEQAA